MTEAGRTVRWERVGDRRTAAIAYEVPGHPYKDRVLAWVSVTEPGMLGRVIGAVDRELRRYGTMHPDIRSALSSDADGGAK